MSQITAHDAVGQALAEEMRRDSRVVLFGEGVATKRHELVDEFGADRVRNTPLAEAIIAGTAVGAAASGLRPVVDLLFAPFLTYSMDAIVNSAGKLRYLSGGQFEFPMVVLAMTGAGWAVGGQHNHNLEAMFVHAPGLKVVMPSSAADFKGLLKAAIRDDNPVLFFEHKQLYRTRWPVPDPYRDAGHVGEFGRAAVRREGTQLTVVATLTMVHHALAAAQALASEGLSVEVIDPRTLVPFDVDTVVASVRKTGRLLVVDEAYLNFGIQAEVIAAVTERAFDALKAAPRRLGNPGVPVPFAPPLQDEVLPGRARIEAAIREMLSR